MSPETPIQSAPAAAAPAPGTRWQRIRLVISAIEVRLRFIVILVITGVVIGDWDAIQNHWEKWTRPGPAPVQAEADTELYCPMHPSVVRPVAAPGAEVSKCPICGMPLALRKKGAVAPLGADVTGRVQLSPERIELAGVRTDLVGYRRLEKEVVAVGSVQYDEARLSRIVARVDGYIEKLLADESYVEVAEGAPLAEIYSPELYSATRELAVAIQTKAPATLVSAARERLKLFGVGDREIQRSLDSTDANHRLLIRSPQHGQIIARNVVEGAYVTVGMTLFEVADVSRVWIEAEVFERDIALVKAGQDIEATVEAYPNRVFSGQVALVHAHLDPTTRTNTVRFALENPHLDLRPGMFATVRIRIPLGATEPFRSLGAVFDAAGNVLAVDEAAVIDTGTRKIVYLERKPGLYEGVLVELGPRIGSSYPVVKGLQAGDRIVSRGAFLVDAETRLNPAAASAFLGAGGGPSPAGAATGQPAPQAGPRPVAVDPGSWEGFSAAERAAAEAQGACPISHKALGSMGTPEKRLVRGHPVFLCCPGCEEKFERDPEAALLAASPPAGGGR